MRSVKQSRLKHSSETLKKCVKLGCCFPGLLWPLSSDISVYTNAGVGAGGEWAAVPEALWEAAPEKTRHAMERHIRLFFDMAILFQIPGAPWFRDLCAALCSISMPAVAMWLSKMQLSSACSVLLISSAVLWYTTLLASLGKVTWRQQLQMQWRQKNGSQFAYVYAVPPI